MPTSVSSLLARPAATDSPLRLCALSRLCVALYRKSFADGGLQGTSSLQAACTRQGNALFRVIGQKMHTGLPLADKCLLLSELYTLMGETDYLVNPRKQEAWDTMTDEVLDAFFSLPAPASPVTVAAACRCLLDLFYFGAPDDDDAWWQYLKSTLSAWASACSETDGWGSSVSLSEALERVELLNRYSYMYLDRTFDDVLRRAYRFYTGRAAGCLDSCPPSVLGSLYSLALAGNAWKADRTLALQALEALQRQATTQSTDDCNLYILSWQTDWQCRAEMEIDYQQNTI